MIRKPMTVLFVLFFSVLSLQSVVAKDDGINRDRINKTMQELFEAVPTEINQTAIPGLVEVIVPPRVIYMSTDGRFILSGDIWDVETSENITEPKRVAMKSKVNDKLLKDLDEDSMIVFKAKNEKYKVTVFTDITCGYCRKLHSEISQYNKNGITVRYMAYPRGGVGSDGFKYAAAVWCSNKPNAAMTTAKAGGSIKEAKCKHPIVEHYNTAQSLGINYTPAIILPNGQIFPGYLPADKLLEVLKEIDKNGSVKLPS